MNVRSRFHQVDRNVDHNIVFIKDDCAVYCYRVPTVTNDAENVVNAILDEIGKALARGDRVEIRGFGAFSTKQRDARVGRNPRTGDHVPVEEKLVPVFRAGKETRARINRSRQQG